MDANTPTPPALPRTKGRFHPLVRVLLFLGMLLLIAAPLIVAHSIVRKRLGFERHTLSGDLLGMGLQVGLILAVLGTSRFALLRFNGLPFSALGFAREGSWKRELLIGLGVGAFFPLLVAGVGALLGLATFEADWSTHPHAMAHFLVAVASMVGVAVLEESLFRGYAFQEMQRWRGKWVALVGTFLLFGGLHLTNPGGTVQGVVTSGLVGAALYATYVATGRLWIAVGFHFAWNTVLSVVLGFTNGGEHLSGALLRSELRGPTVLSGGAFGPEASLFAVLAALALVLVASRSKAAGPGP